MPEITPTILYKHMQDFVEKDGVRFVFKHIWFDGEHAVATNTHVLCAVKYKAEPHFETTDGTPAELDMKFPAWERLMIKDKEAEACVTLPSETLDNLSDWVRLLKFIVQATKKRGGQEIRPVPCARHQEARAQAHSLFFDGPEYDAYESGAVG